MNSQQIINAVETIAKKHDGFSFCCVGQVHSDYFYGIEEGRKYHKLYHSTESTHEYRSVVCFIDVEAGIIYRADSWKKRGRPICDLQTLFTQAS